MSTQRTDIRITGRLVQGSLYDARDKDADGNPLMIKNGPDAGKPRVDYYIAVAVAKTPGHTHWSQTEWGALVYQAAAAAMPNFVQSLKFAWKIEDGDSTVPNGKGVRPCDREGFPGHWIVRMSGGYAPKVYQQTSPGVYVEMTAAGAVKLGYHVMVAGNVAANMSTQQPGVYINHGMVLFVRPDTEIRVGPDAATAFAGAPVSAALPGVAAAAPMPFAPPAAAAPQAVTPLPAFLAIPGAPAAAAPVPVPVAVPVPPVPAAPVATPPARRLTAAAQGATYEQLIGLGWTDQTLVANGLMLA